MGSVFFITFFPFVFAFVIAFFLFYKYATPLYIPFVVSIFSFCSVFVSSLLQVLFSFLQINIRNYSFFLGTLFNSYIYSSTIEESIKVLFFYFVLRLFYQNFKGKENIKSASLKTGNAKMILLVAMFFAACFAAFENISYIAKDINTLATRMCTSTLLHIFIAQYYLYLKSNWYKKIFLSVCVPIFVHGSYNLFIALNGKFVILSFVILIFIIIQGIHTMIGKLKER